jgi:tetratricopeptide (TPR) repeat protein
VAELHYLSNSRGALKANVVFLHGLGGHPLQTWQATKDERTLWPRWLAEDINGLAIWSVGYEAPISRWSGTAMHLVDRAENILGRFITQPELQDGRIILIGHSLGGLVIKQLFRTLEMEAKNGVLASSLLERIDKVAFLATPHAGADLAVWGDRLRVFVRPSAATLCLVRNDPNLRELNDWYRRWATERGISHLVLRETKPTRILGTIVKPDSSDPALHLVRAWATDHDHSSIAKPKSRADEVYAHVKQFILDPFERPKSRIEALTETLIDGQLRQCKATQDIRADTQDIRSDTQKILLLVAQEKGVPLAPLRAVLERLGAAQIAIEEIPKRLAAAADELIQLRTDLARLRNDRPEFAAIRLRASTLIDKGEFDAARAELRKGREAARALREESSRSEAGFLVDEARVDRLQLNYDDAFAKLTEASRLDPDNCSIWIDLGDLWVIRGSLVEAERSFRSAINAARRSGDERDLSVSYDRIGDVQVAQGNLPEALQSFREGLGIADRLAKADPGNAGWQRDLIVSYVKLAGIDQTGARTFLTQAQQIAEQMQQRGQLAPRDLGMLGELAKRLAALPN